MNTYAEFIGTKTQYGADSGFEPVWMPEFLYPFQKDLVAWALRKGRAAIFADCGLGKTPMELVWSENIVRKTGGNVLVLCPLAVGPQTVREGEKFGIEVHHSRDGSIKPGITVTNYQQLAKFNPSDFTAVVGGESSILKDSDSATRVAVTEFMRAVPYRLLETGTPGPNDYPEYGTSSEALGYLGYVDMLFRFFKNEQGKGAAASRSYGKAVEWRLRSYAEQQFWQWICSWSWTVRKPSDMGYPDGDFVLPPIAYREHLIQARSTAPDRLFEVEAHTMEEQREEQRRTIAERCEMTASLVNHSEQALVWCQLNDEGKVLGKAIPGAIEVSGADSDESKESKFAAFQRGDVRVLITKPKIGAWGLNLQNCAHVTFFPSHSFEQFYQGVRRCYRFGQKRPVTVDIVTTEGGRGILNNLQKKQERADVAFERLSLMRSQARGIDRPKSATGTVEVPTWL